MESENQVLRQQSLAVATADEDKSKQIERYILQYAYLHSHPFFSGDSHPMRASQVKKWSV